MVSCRLPLGATRCVLSLICSPHLHTITIFPLTYLLHRLIFVIYQTYADSFPGCRWPFHASGSALCLGSSMYLLPPRSSRSSGTHRFSKQILLLILVLTYKQQNGNSGERQARGGQGMVTRFLEPASFDCFEDPSSFPFQQAVSGEGWSGDGYRGHRPASSDCLEDPHTCSTSCPNQQ